MEEREVTTDNVTTTEELSMADLLTAYIKRERRPVGASPYGPGAYQLHPLLHPFRGADNAE